MANDAWEPGQYERFHAERTSPFVDLLALIERRPGVRVVDLGCGTGELTRRLHVELQARETVGVDSSPSMLARAHRLAGGGLRFEEGDIAGFAAVGDFDVVFSHAALHWVPDHPTLFARLTDALRPGGQLAVQVPANADSLAHRVVLAVARERPFVEVLGSAGERPTAVLDAAEYARLLARLGYRRQLVRMQVYGHWLESREDVVEWTKGTLLTAYRRRLPPELYAAFLDRYRQALLPQLEDTRPYFFPFKRLLLWAAR